MGGGICLEKSRSLGQVRWLLHQQAINMADVKLNTLLAGCLTMLKIFLLMDPFNQKPGKQ